MTSYQTSTDSFFFMFKSLTIERGLLNIRVIQSNGLSSTVNSDHELRCSFSTTPLIVKRDKHSIDFRSIDPQPTLRPCVKNPSKVLESLKQIPPNHIYAYGAQKITFFEDMTTISQERLESYQMEHWSRLSTHRLHKRKQTTYAVQLSLTHHQGLRVLVQRVLAWNASDSQCKHVICTLSDHY